MYLGLSKYRFIAERSGGGHPVIPFSLLDLADGVLSKKWYEVYSWNKCNQVDY